MIVLSIDPGIHCAYCVWKRNINGVLFPCKVVAIKDPTVNQCLEIMQSISSDWSESELAIEDQFFVPKEVAGDYEAAPVQDVMDLVERRARWQHAGQILSAKVTLYQPRSWQSSFRGYPGERAKERVEKGVRLIYLCDFGKNSNKYDAVGIGKHHIDKMKKEEKKERNAIKQISLF